MHPVCEFENVGLFAENFMQIDQLLFSLQWDEIFPMVDWIFDILLLVCFQYALVSFAYNQLLRWIFTAWQTWNIYCIMSVAQKRAGGEVKKRRHS